MQTVIAVSNRGDVYPAQVAAREMAATIGFDQTVGEEIVLVVSELATNLVRHAGGGDLVLMPVSERNREGIQIESRDKGPGIMDIEKAFGDGYSTAAGPGYGMGTINRLMDELDVSPATEDLTGAHITCRRWIRKFDRTPLAFSIGVASRPHPLMTVNGDSFVVRQWEQKALIAVIDGLGHGQYAHRAAETARQFVETHFDSTLASIFVGVARACVATRGVVMAAARFDAAQGAFSFASIGNVEARTFNSLEPPKLLITRGILGHTYKLPVVNNCPWDPDSVFVMHSDGLRSRWQWEDFNFGNAPPIRIARELMLKLGRKEDDATVIVVKRAVE